jgi:anthranilate/para-aminobenzoate synthase component I
VTVVGDDRAAVDELSRLLSCSPETAPGPVSIEWLPAEAPELHAARIQTALDLIAAGEIYQVNLARRIDLSVSGRACDILASLCRDTRPPYAAALRFGGLSVVSTSPELLLRQSNDGRLLTSPIKGTRPRGGDAESDARWARELGNDPKERAELSMIIDVERNDLGRVSAFGSVRLQGPPFVASQGLVWHRRANVVGRLRPDVSRRELLLAMLPSGSVTGAPKVRAMEIIARLESERRGLYTGAIGFINQKSELTLAMAIRTLTLRDGVGHYFTGGGIVADSNPALELEETRWKALQLIGRAGTKGIPAGKVVP